MTRRDFLAAAPLAPFAGVAAGFRYRSARPVWPAGREREKNLFVGFRAAFDAPGEPVRVRIAASTVYRLFLNGEFLGYGPARAAHGFYRVDTWELPESGRAVVALEVAGYNVNSYYLLDQPSFLQAEVEAGGRVLASTAGQGEQFEAAILPQRVQKVQRYSFQRPFCEVYRLQSGWDAWRGGAGRLDLVVCETVDAKRLLPRGVPLPGFALRQPLRQVAEGTLSTGPMPEKPWKDRALTGIGPQLGGYREEELAVIPSLDLQKIVSRRSSAPERPYGWQETLPLPAGSFRIFDFGINLTGFPGAALHVTRAAKLYFTFDETLTAGDVDWKRLGSVNIVTWELEPGSYRLEAFEPYTMRYLKLMLAEGEAEVRNVYLREYANPGVWTAEFASSDEGLNRLFAAGRETYRQNAVDLFTDCPHRERAGWLCDSFFTARVGRLLSGDTVVERNFLENFALPERFEFLPEGMLPMCYPADHNDGIFIPNWALWFVLQLEEYLRRSGDRPLVEKLRARVLRLFEYFRPFRNSDGLLENLKSWVFIEWSAANDFVQDVNYPSNMLYAAALEAAGRMYARPDLLAEAGRLRAAIRKQSFDGQFFVDNAVRQGGVLAPTRNRTEVCQYFAFYFGVATPATHAALWKVLRDEFGPGRKQKKLYPEIHEANAFVGNVLRLELLSREGLVRQLVEESRAYLLYMADRTGTLWENVDPRASLNHGFASHVINVLDRDVLGVAELDPVRKTVVLRFADCGLAWCEGRIPVPGGAVALRWRREGGKLIHEIEVPAGYTVAVDERSR